LTVTDVDGLHGNDNLAVEVLEGPPPPIVDQLASGELFVAGMVSGSYLDTHNSDGVAQSITERESGGRKPKRHSYLEHVWLFDVQPGDAMSLVVSGSQSTSSDGDRMQISYRLPGGNYQTPVITLGTVMAEYIYPLPATTSGEVRVRITDSDRGAGHRTLDTVTIDQIYIRTENSDGGIIVAMPTWGVVSATIDSVNLEWNDNSNNENGFRVERSTDQTNWSPVGDFPTDTVNYVDFGLTANTTYSYRIQAYAGATSSARATTSIKTQNDGPGSDITLTANGYKIKGRQKADLSWLPAQNVTIHRDGGQIKPEPVSGDSYTDNIDKKGGGTYRYKVCMHASPNTCSSEAVVVF